jgi:hypothetical protein
MNTMETVIHHHLQKSSAVMPALQRQTLVWFFLVLPTNGGDI